MASEAQPSGERGRDHAGVLTSALTRRGRQRFTGTLRMDGSPGGSVSMRDGLVVAASTPAAPGPEPLLLRSGRISEADWSAAFTAGAPDGRLERELVVRGLLGDAGVQVITRAAVADALFAMALCGVRTCTADPDDPAPLLASDPGLDTERAIREIRRRLDLAHSWTALGLSIRSRPQSRRPTGSVPVNAQRQELLAKVNGRRTPRDIAFALGRGLFPVMSDMATLIVDGLATVEPPLAGGSEAVLDPAPGGGPAARPRELPSESVRSQAAPPPPHQNAPSQESAGLPRRRYRNTDFGRWFQEEPPT
ncbi:hypothetical protein OG979_27640 [Actinomadura citrea]|uniref:hypothetical protein n=1 Tax=Actinomadura citrea TaxID=46158 RepID=UPI002E2A6F2A|nr:hypothetical protein [Actinomadura citrea]